MKTLKYVGPVAAALAVALGAGPTATAQPQPRPEPDYSDWSEVRDCGNGMTLDIAATAHGFGPVTQRGSDDWWYAADRVHVVITATNPGNGESFVETLAGVDVQDQRLVIDRGGSSSPLVDSSEQVYGPDGHLAFHAAGLASDAFAVGGDVVQFVETVKSAGRGTVPGGLCEIARAFWG